MLSSRLYWPARRFGALESPYSDLDSARFVVIPVPYDSTTTWRAGTREGAMAIIQASINMELYDREFGREIYQAGIHTTAEVEPDMSGPEGMANRVQEVIAEVFEARKVPVMLGGEHSLTLGGVRALAARANSLTVVQLDAHTDLRDSYSGTQFGHGCVMRRASEIPGVRIIQVGLRSSSQEEIDAVPANVTQFWAEDLLADFPGQLRRIVELIEGDVYLTFDVDCCDPSWMPDTGTPEPGGLSYYEIRDVLRAVCRTGRVRAVDCLELIGGHPASAFAVARLLYKTMGYLSE